jgi:hypothetical protein
MEQYKTTNIGLATVLVMQGQDLKEVAKSNDPYKCDFIFDDVPAVYKIVDKYFGHEIKVDVLDFQIRFKELLNRTRAIPMGPPNAQPQYPKYKSPYKDDNKLY